LKRPRLGVALAGVPVLIPVDVDRAPLKLTLHRAPRRPGSRCAHPGRRRPGPVEARTSSSRRPLASRLIPVDVDRAPLKRGRRAPRGCRAGASSRSTSTGPR